MNLPGNSDNCRVWYIEPLRLPGQDEAQKILEKLAKEVEPIMRKHNWRVKLLSEFIPWHPRLMGLNHERGAMVNIRLRQPYMDWFCFLPYDEILDILLHELCHNDHSLHNDEFHTLWAEIREECKKNAANTNATKSRETSSSRNANATISRQSSSSRMRDGANSLQRSNSRSTNAMNNQQSSGSRNYNGWSDTAISTSHGDGYNSWNDQYQTASVPHNNVWNNSTNGENHADDPIIFYVFLLLFISLFFLFFK